eukprot:scaffold171782_cov23-Tisochrysis_lutea.AAC.2
MRPRASSSQTRAPAASHCASLAATERQMRHLTCASEVPGYLSGSYMGAAGDTGGKSPSHRTALPCRPTCTAPASENRPYRHYLRTLLPQFLQRHIHRWQGSW